MYNWSTLFPSSAYNYSIAAKFTTAIIVPTTDRLSQLQFQEPREDKSTGSSESDANKAFTTRQLIEKQLDDYCERTSIIHYPI